MPTPAELAYQYSDLSSAELEHLQRLLGSWSLLADLSFSDLLLLAPVAPSRHAGLPQLVVLGQMRPNNHPTMIEQDLVGLTIPESEFPLASDAMSRGHIVRGEAAQPVSGVIENIPVGFGGSVVGVIVRVIEKTGGRPMSLYEKTYLDVFDRLAEMVVEAAFPFPETDVGAQEAPRVGDGVVVVDSEGKVEFASPNALNAFHRMGVYSPPEGKRLDELGVEEAAVDLALFTGRPVVEEVEQRPDVMVLVHCIPLLVHGTATGAMILMRDVTDVRRLDRLLLSKDAAIREVHHRVKNNLQTISSLLRLQARRVGSAAGREALWEAERRVRSIAVVHEILSRDPSDQVPFNKIVESLVQMAEDSIVSPEPIEITVSGDLGDVKADMATPLAVTLAEVLQNAVEHAFVGRDPKETRRVTVTLKATEDLLFVCVRDDGIGLPEGFDIEQTISLGLSIVRDLVVSQLAGSIAMENVASSDGGGTLVSIEVPVSRG